MPFSSPSHDMVHPPPSARVATLNTHTHVHGSMGTHMHAQTHTHTFRKRVTLLHAYKHSKGTSCSLPDACFCTLTSLTTPSNGTRSDGRSPGRIQWCEMGGPPFAGGSSERRRGGGCFSLANNTWYHFINPSAVSTPESPGTAGPRGAARVV